MAKKTLFLNDVPHKAPLQTCATRNEMDFRTAASDKNHRSTRLSKFCFWVGSYIREKQLLSTYVHLSKYAYLQRHKVGTYLLKKRNFGSGNCVSSSCILWYFLHHYLVCMIRSQAVKAQLLCFLGECCNRQNNLIQKHWKYYCSLHNLTFWSPYLYTGPII